MTRRWRSDSWLRLAGSDSSAAAVNQKSLFASAFKGEILKKLSYEEFSSNGRDKSQQERIS